MIGIRGETWRDCLRLAARLCKTEAKTPVWEIGKGGRLAPVLNGVTSAEDKALWEKAAEAAGIDLGEWIEGPFVRVFRSKGFQTLTGELVEALWEQERALVGEWEGAGRFQLFLHEADRAIRNMLLDNKAIRKVSAASDVKTGAVEWMPRGQLANIGALQVELEHVKAIGGLTSETFAGPLPKEAGETGPQRHVWGYFYDQGMRSVWTVLLTEAELSDNHQITKRFRRIKQVLSKMFQGEAWLGVPQEPSNLEFSDLIVDEHFKLIHDVPVQSVGVEDPERKLGSKTDAEAEEPGPQV